MEKLFFEVRGNIIDVVAGRIFQGTVAVENGIIASIREEPVSETGYILPGLIDAHIHIESSMLIPSEFARIAVVHGTVGTVSDPHEIANVVGIPGVRFMIENGQKVPFKFNFGAPSCVPATGFETSGAKLGVGEVEELLQMKEIKYLSEMMNFPGVLYEDPQVMAMLALAKKAGKPVDGHAPGVMGEQAEKYINAGITTDHECFTIDEALEKIKYGMKILIRNGSAAKNFETLYPLIDSYPDKVMLCSDDKHPNDLVVGHINQEVKQAIAKGLNIFNILRSCTLNPVRHYNLEIGLLQKGDPADFIMIDDLRNFNILSTYIDGKKVAENGVSYIPEVPVSMINNFNISPVTVNKIRIKSEVGNIRIQQALDGQLITRLLVEKPLLDSEGFVISDPSRDILKLVVVNRYHKAMPTIGFINNIGLKQGAMASCVAHDSHNIIAVGVDDESITQAINMIIESKGGISLVSGDEKMTLPLPIAGIMTNQSGITVAGQYERMDQKAKEMGSSLSSPYMTLSFMALLVIPELKIGDLGIFDGNKFEFTTLFEK